jgi:hypothetical protein
VDAKLREQLTKFAETTLRNLTVDGAKVTLEMMVRKTQLPVAKNARILAPMDFRRRLINARLWQPSTEEICSDWATDLLIGILRKEREAAGKVELTAARERQLSLFPGFETLPSRIRVGPKYIVFAGLNLAQFLNYEGEYQAKAAKDQRRAAELHKIAEKVRVYGATNPEMPLPEAFARAEAQAAKFRAVVKLG